MSEDFFHERLFSTAPKKRFGKYNLLGMVQLGFSNLGDSDIYFIRAPLGIFVLGLDQLGDSILLSGVYQEKTRWPGWPFSREKYYIPKNPRTDPQQTNRGKFAAAVAAWQSLTPEQKKAYNKKAVGKHMSGYNLYLSEFMYG